jgi:uncharacterized protein (TIGR03000 family)
MSQRFITTSVLAAAALFGCLLTAGPAAAGQGWNLYSWSGGYQSTFSNGYPLQNASNAYPAVGYQAAYRPAYAPGVAAARVTNNAAFYDSPPAVSPVADNRAHIRITLPANAEVRFEGDKTTQTGANRLFVSPPLKAGHNYIYEVKAQWKENGQEVTRDRRITVRAGEVVNVPFGEAKKDKSNMVAQDDRE